MDIETIAPSDELEECQTTSEDDQSATIEFPPQAFSGLFKDYLDLIGSCTEAPSPYHWVTFLTMSGLLLGRNVYMRQPYPVYPNFYSLLIGRTGLGRKSTAMKCGERELLGRVPNNITSVKGALSSEGIYQRLSVREGTRILLYCDEMRSFLNVSSRQGTADIIPRLNTLYDCPDDDDLTRRSDSITIKLPFVSFIAGTPKEWLITAVGEGEIMGGFINRFLFVEGLRHKTIPFPEPPDPDAAKSLADDLTLIVDRCVNSPVEMGWSGDARSMYDTFYRAWHERQLALPESTAAVTNRIPDHVVKIGMVYSVLAGEDQIIPDTIATAIQIGEYLETTASRLFSDTGLSKQGRVEQMIITRLRAHGGMMGLRELQQAIGGKTDAESFNRAITNLEKAEQIKVTSSKPKVVVYIGN